MAKSTEELRESWKNYECNDEAMVVVPFGPDRIRVAPETVPAWDALAAVLSRHGYRIRTADTDSYNCRNIKGTDEKSLHAFGIALDINWTTNPWIDHAGTRKVRFSDGASQDDRANDVRLGKADTDFTEALIADVMAIKTRAGTRVFEWGGHWRTVKDSMHFEIDLDPQELANGIDTSTVAGWEEFVMASRQGAEAVTALSAAVAALPDLPDLPDIPDLPDLPELPDLPDLSEVHGAAAPPHAAAPAPITAAANRFIVNARDGLRLRAGPDTSFEVKKTLVFGTAVTVLQREGAWAQVDVEGDGAADGFAHASFLVPAAGQPSGPVVTAPAAPSGTDILDMVTPDRVKAMFPAATSLARITANLPFVIAGLRSRGLVDKPLVLMALGTVRAETEGFVPIDEGISQFNTAHTPFDLYDAGTSIGQRLGNTQPGDGPRFKGRGYVQLTGRDNYTRIGPQVGHSLVTQPTLANDPTIAGAILAQFLKNKETAIRAALAAGNLAKARKLVNGGSHGLDRFKDTFNRGMNILPG